MIIFKPVARNRQYLDKGSSATCVGLIPPVPMDMVLRPGRLCCSVAGAGENSTASADRGRPADNFLTSSPPVDFTPPPPPMSVRGFHNCRRTDSAGSAGLGLSSCFFIQRLCRREIHRLCRYMPCGGSHPCVVSSGRRHPSCRPALPGRPHLPSGCFCQAPKGARWLAPPSGRQRGSNSASLSTTAAHFCMAGAVVQR